MIILTHLTPIDDIIEREKWGDVATFSSFENDNHRYCIGIEVDDYIIEYTKIKEIEEHSTKLVSK